MAAERNFWQVLVVTGKNEGVHTRVLEYPTRELAEETIAACAVANTVLQYTFVTGIRLYPAEDANVET